MIAIYFMIAALLVVGSNVAKKPPVDESNECPISPVIKNFDIKRYLGYWYNIQEIPNRFFTTPCEYQQLYIEKAFGNVTIEFNRFDV